MAWDYRIHRRPLREFREVGKRHALNGEWYAASNRDYAEQHHGGKGGKSTIVFPVLEPIVPFTFKNESLTYYEAGYRDGLLYYRDEKLYTNIVSTVYNVGELPNYCSEVPAEGREADEYLKGWLDGSSERYGGSY